MEKNGKSFAVIGCGRFGGSVVEELARQRADVLAIDSNEEIVKKYVNIATEAIILDSTDEEALKSIGIRNIDHVIVGIGHDFKASILTVLILKDIGVKEVSVKVVNENHKKVILKIGADAVIQPEKDTGKRVAFQILSGFFSDYSVLSDTHSIVGILATAFIIGETLINLNIPQRFGVNITAIKRNGQIIVPQAHTEIKEGDVLLVMGENDDVFKLNRWLLKR